MSEQPKNDIHEATARTGMSFLANRLVAGQIAAGGMMAVFDKGSSAEQRYYRKFNKRR